MFKAFLKTAIPFGIFVGLFAWLSFSPAIALVIGTLGGAGFGLMISVFVAYQKKQFKQNPVALLPGEQIIKEGGANHNTGAEAVGGWLSLTNRRLLFRSHKFNYNNHETEIYLDTIKQAVPWTTLGILPTSIKVILTDEREERFVVENRKEWCVEINRSVESHNEPSNFPSV